MNIYRFIRQKFFKREYEFEIFQQCVFLRNLAFLQEERELSADYIFEMLITISGSMKGIYIEMLKLYRRGKEEEAFAYIGREIGGRIGPNFARLLRKIESLPPSEILSQIESFQETLREKRVSENSKMVEKHSLIATICATLVIFSILINFTVVVVMLDTMRMLRESF